MPQCRLDVLQSKLELVGIELLGTGTETMAHEGVDDRLKPLDLSVGLALGDGQLSDLSIFGRVRLGEHPGLLEDQHAERVIVLGQIRFGEHEESESSA